MENVSDIYDVVILRSIGLILGLRATATGSECLEVFNLRAESVF